MAATATTERGGALRLIETKVQPKETLTVEQIAARTGLDNTKVANAINPRVAKKNGWTRVKRGTYRYLGYKDGAAAPIKVKATKATKRRGNPAAAAALASRHLTNGSTADGMKVIGTSLDGTPLLQGSDGALYKAVPLA